MENGVNSEIEFYALELDSKYGKIADNSISINICGPYYDISYIAYKKDDEENGVMIDLLTGIEIYPISKQFEPMLRYKSKRLATLNELENTSYICSMAKNGNLEPLNSYTDKINRLVKHSNEYYQKYVANMEGILTYLFETKPELDENKKSLI